MRTIGCFVLMSGFAAAIPVAAQQPQGGAPSVLLEAEPASIVVTVGDSVPLRITVRDAQGATVSPPLRVSAPRRAVDVRAWRETGYVKGLAAGTYEIVAFALDDSGQRPTASLTVPVTVRWPAVTQLVIHQDDGRLYEGAMIRHTAEALHADGSPRPDANVRWSSSDPSVATVDPYGQVTATGTGAVTIEAGFENVTGSVTYDVAPFPAARIELTGGADEVRTGDVQTFTATAYDAGGQPIEDLPIAWSHRFTPAPGIAAPQSPGQLDGNRFVADVPGVFTVVASAGPLSATRSFRVRQRDVVRPVEVLGQGRITDHYTSDVWPWQGVDGRDYAMTGSRQGMSHAYVWDITDPTDIIKTDSIIVDARSVNDVKISPDGRYGVVTREGASNRRNGVVILDLADPAHPKIASTFDEGLTGGVHNAFATNDYLFALAGGDKYVILDVRDIYDPKYVSEYDHPDSRIHDVWVHDGIAYSAEWETGVVVVDVGNGRWGGTIEEPVFVTAFPLPTGRTHAVFPYYSQSANRFYLFVGDEIIGRPGRAWQGTGPDFRMPYDPETGRGGYPRATAGYIQIVDFTDPENPEMVARYEVPEYGTHNIWVEDDILYQAYYEGGARMVDVSGELMGNLYTQGREIAVFKAHDPRAWIANAPAAWSVIPYKGNIFFSDNTSGLWAVRLAPPEVTS
ncbi:MAG: Ig-like domain-containing protein [Longimicrobiales bacterium]